MADVPDRKRPPKNGKDVALLCGRSEDGKSIQIIRRRNDTLEAGVVQPLEEGKPLTGEVVTLTPRAGQPLLCDVEVHHDARTTASKSTVPAPPTKPAKVASDAYRSNWDTIWSSGKKRSSLPN